MRTASGEIELLVVGESVAAAVMDRSRDRTLELVRTLVSYTP